MHHIRVERVVERFTDCRIYQRVIILHVRMVHRAKESVFGYIVCNVL